MAILTDYENIENSNPIYDGNTKYIEVTKGDYYYLINDETHEIKMSNETPILEKAHDFIIKHDGEIVEGIIVGGIIIGAIILFKNPAAAARLGALGANATRGIINALAKLRRIPPSEITKEVLEHPFKVGPGKNPFFAVGAILGIQNGFRTAEAAPALRYDPIVLDLNGDGTKTTTIANGVYFDHANDGFAESTAWVDSNDGILVVDTNANGTIDNGTELVTNLSTYDTNNDGIINSSDTNFSSLKILKGDGTLQTLTAAGVKSINTTTTASTATDSNGNTLAWTGSYTKTDNTTASMTDYNFLTNPAYSIETSTVAVSDTIAALPDISGQGTVHSLHQAMALDTDGSLQTLVESFIATTDLAAKRAILTNIIYEWCGADLISSTSRGTNIDAKKLYVIEKFLGENFVGAEGANPNSQAANLLNSAYANLSNYIYAQLESQTALKPLYDLITLEYDSTKDKIMLNLTQVASAIQAAIQENETTGKALLTDFDNTFKALNLKENSYYNNFNTTFSVLGEDYKKGNICRFKTGLKRCA